jgi:hypothetical protein
LAPDGTTILALIQPGPLPRHEDLLEDRGRPHVVAMVSDVLASLDADPGGTPTIVVVPELALGSGDFAALNEAVRRLRRPAVVLSGFGFTRGAELASALRRGDCLWRGTAEPDEIDVDARYNGGWCWIHGPQRTTACHLFLKNFLDKRMELSAPDLTTARWLLRIDTADLVIFPLICADLLSRGSDSSEARLRRSLTDVSADSKRVLIVGLLATLRPDHPLWETSLSDFVQLPGCEQHQLLVVTANHVLTESDPTRTLTGVFAHDGNLRSDDSSCATTVGTARGIAPPEQIHTALIGPLRWPTDGPASWIPARRDLAG